MLHSIRIQDKTKKTLDMLKVVKCETYNSVIERLIDLVPEKTKKTYRGRRVQK